MKKLLALLGAASAVAAPATAVIACVQPQTDNNTNNGGDTDTDGEDTGKVDEDKAAELEANPFDLSSLAGQFHFMFKVATIENSEAAIVDRINEEIKDSTVKITYEDLDIQYERSFQIKNTDLEGEQPGDIERDVRESYLYATDKMTVTASKDFQKYLSNSFEVVIEKYDLSTSEYSPVEGESILDFVGKISKIYSDMFGGFTPYFYTRLNMTHIDEDGKETKVIFSNASTLFYTKNAKVIATADPDDELFTGGFTYGVSVNKN